MSLTITAEFQLDLAKGQFKFVVKYQDIFWFYSLNMESIPC
jgi:hypothetical protein